MAEKSGTKPYSSMRFKMRSRVAGSTSGFWFSTRDTVAVETPARRAISWMVSRSLIASSRRWDVQAEWTAAFFLLCHYTRLCAKTEKPFQELLFHMGATFLQVL